MPTACPPKQRVETTRGLAQDGAVSFVTVERVLGAGPFAEVGHPAVAVMSGDATLIAAGGHSPSTQWHGNDVSGRTRPHAGWHPLAVYRADDLACVRYWTTRWRPN